MLVPPFTSQSRQVMSCLSDNSSQKKKLLVAAMDRDLLHVIHYLLQRTLLQFCFSRVFKLLDDFARILKGESSFKDEDYYNDVKPRSKWSSNLLLK